MNRQKNLKAGRINPNQFYVQSFCEKLSEIGVQALIEEVSLTPKPGLVDLFSNGAHKDLNYELMKKSAKALRNCFYKIAYVSYGRKPDISLRKQLSIIGIEGEKYMLRKTNGVNTHKGAIWIIGLLISSISMAKGDKSMKTIMENSKKLANIQLELQKYEKLTHGKIAIKKFKVNGAKGEAMDGFPHIFEIGLPVFLKEVLKRQDKSITYGNTLLAIMEVLDDTCILHRGGAEGLRYLKSEVKKVINLGGYGTDCGRKKLYELDSEFIKHNLSSGGAADLLAATIFLFFMKLY